MSRVIMGRGDVQPPTRGLGPLNVAGNGRIAKSPAQLAQLLNGISGARRRVLAQWSVRPGDNAGVGGADWDTIARFRVKPSYHAERIRAVVVALPSSSTDNAFRPAFRWRAIETRLASPGIPQTFRQVDVGKRKTAAVVPNDYFVWTQTLGPSSLVSSPPHNMVPLGEYEVWLEGRGAVRVLSITLYEQRGRLWIESPDDAGDGDSFAFTGPYTQLVDAGASFDQSHVGGELVITGATSAGNNGRFWIHHVVNATTIQYENGSGVTEAFGASTRYRIRAPSVAVGRASAPILDDQVGRMFDVAHQIWRHGGGRLFDWAEEKNPKTVTSATYVNIHDTTYTAWNAVAPGHWVWPTGLGARGSSQIPVVCWARAASTIGQLRFAVQGRAVATLVFGAGGVELVAATGWLDPANAEDKVDILGLTGSSLGVYAYGMYQEV